jgi:threonine dehydrogenase-like Zn-dependent dehydrogenase
MLIYRGDAPQDLSADESLSSLGGSLAFPLKYGYACVGVVEALGAEVESSWLGRRVFAFNPHETHFVASVGDLQVLSDDVENEDAVFLPNMETAVNFMLDGQPLVGEEVVVVGQGVVGLLTTALLSRFPLSRLTTVDGIAARRMWSEEFGASESLDVDQALQLRGGQADLSFELSGSPAALDSAIALTRFSGRVVIGSWYGIKRASLDLGGRFHRSRVKLISSQVSTLTPELMARWTKSRRLDVAWHWLKSIRPSRLISHRIPFQHSAEAYALLDRAPSEALQIVIEYADE